MGRLDTARAFALTVAVSIAWSGLSGCGCCEGHEASPPADHCPSDTSDQPSVRSAEACLCSGVAEPATRRSDLRQGQRSAGAYALPLFGTAVPGAGAALAPATLIPAHGRGSPRPLLVLRA